MQLSCFKNFTDTAPYASTLENVVDCMRSDDALAKLTEAHRADPGRGLKEQCPLFAVACRFDGGKARKHVSALTGLSLVDIDKVSPEQLPVLRQAACRDPHTLLCHVTVGGAGLRILFRYDCDTGYSLEQQMQFYPKAFACGNSYYARLTGTETDEKCKNVTRLSVICHDDDVFCNPDALPFTQEEIEAESRRKADAGHRERRQRREALRLERCYEEEIRPEVEAEGAVYAPGSHNDYVMRVGYRLNQFGFSREAATEWAAQRFPDYDKAASVVASCYSSRPGEFATRGGRKRSNGHSGGGMATVEDIQHYLQHRIALRHNVISGRVECGPDWRPIDDRTVNSLWRGMSETQRVNVQDLYRVIESDYVAQYHPFRNYLEALAPWDGLTDHIALLADTVTVKDAPQELFARYLRKWLVGMVAAWVDETVVNNVILVLIGEQGSYKTTWFNHLLPPPLRPYFYTKTNANRMGRDDLLTLAQYGLVCCEELDTMRPAELNQLKAAVTMPSIDERAAYAHFHEHRKHIASFCGTGNNAQFLSDPTGNRRWLPFEVERIVSPREHPFDYAGIYAQAYALYRSGFCFWFSKEEIAELTEHNRRFETPRLEHELVQLYFRLPTEQETGEFYSVGRAMQIVGSAVTQKLSATNVGRAFRDLGFRGLRYQGVRGYLAKMRNCDEITRIQHIMAHDADADT